MKDSLRLNPEQRQAVRHGDGPLLIIAGAGTGKTTVITQRITHLILEKQVLPSEILALTFTEKAAREMEERVDIALPYGYTQLWISTFHAFCDRILRDEVVHIGLNPGFRLMTEAEAMLFLRKNLFQLHLEYFRPLGNPYKFIQGLLTHFNRLKDDDITPVDYLSFVKKKEKDPALDSAEIKKLQELSQAYSTYETLKTKEGVMDFSDLNANALKLFRERKNILSIYQKKFKYILVDEFQDTNFAQNELAILLARKRKNITVVGDDDQAIYRWRGAAIANIIQFRQHYPEGKVIALTRNYRSTEEILKKSHTLIQANNPDRLEVQEKINKSLTSERGVRGEPIEFIFADRVENEADLVAQKIKLLVKKKQYTYKDFAILVRANDHSQPFVRAFEREKIPFQFLGPGHLFHQEEIKDLIAYLKVLYNFEDNASLYRVLTFSIFNLEARDVASILNFAKKKNLLLFEALEQISDTYLPVETKEKVTHLVDMIKRHLKKVPKSTGGQMLYYFVEDSGLLRKYIEAKSGVEEKQAQNVAKLFERLKSYESEHSDASVFAVVDWIDLSMQLGESPMSSDMDWSENNAVNILTIHSSKGLEFPVVFIVNLVTQRFPTRERKEQIPISDDLIKEQLPEGDATLQEERRLFYVAMTRAKDLLFLTSANYYGEGKRERKISPFVYETLGVDYVNLLLTKHREKTSVSQLTLPAIFQEIDSSGEPDFLQVGKPKITPISYISYSQIQTFDMCPLHYKLRYLLKIPGIPSSALSFGTSVHAVLRDIYQLAMRGEKVTKEQIPEFLSRDWVNQGFESKSHQQTALQQAKKILFSYFEENFPVKNQVLAVEAPFSFSLDGLRVGGRIDRVDKLKNNNIEIIDYKTGNRTLPDEKKLLTDLQMTFYGLAGTEVHDEIFARQPDEVLLSLFFLEANKKVTTMRTKEQLVEAKKLILQKVEEIEHSDFLCNGSLNCKNCEYKMLCTTFAS